MRTYIKCLGKENKTPRDVRCIFEIDNNENTQRKENIIVSVALQEWNKPALTLIFDRIESYIISANVLRLNDISITIKSYSVLSGGAISKDLSDDIYSKPSIIKITHDGNCCFWWSLILRIYQNTDIYKQ